MRGESADPKHQRLANRHGLDAATGCWVNGRPDCARTINFGVETNNCIAIALYTKMGYPVAARVGISIMFLGGNGHPCHVMVKRLNAADA